MIQLLLKIIRLVFAFSDIHNKKAVIFRLFWFENLVNLNYGLNLFIDLRWIHEVSVLVGVEVWRRAKCIGCVDNFF